MDDPVELPRGMVGPELIWIGWGSNPMGERP